MQIAHAHLIQNQLGSDVPVRNITPAEAQLLSSQFRVFAKKHPLHSLTPARKTVEKTTKDGGILHVEEGDVIEAERSPKQEVRRLRAKYGPDVVNKLFPGVNPQVPDTFKDAGFNEDGSLIADPEEETSTDEEENAS